MTSSVSDRGMYLADSSEVEDDDEDNVNGVEEEGDQASGAEAGGRRGNRSSRNPRFGPAEGDAEAGYEDYGMSEEEEEDVDDDDDYSDESPRGAGSRPNSYTTSWPQSYRRSIDVYSSVTPPTIGFLGGTPTQTLSRLGSSFITSSFRGKHTPEIVSSLIKPLLPTSVPPAPPAEEASRKSSHSLLPPPVPGSRRASSKRLLKDDAKQQSRLSVTHQHHEEAVGTPKECTFTQAVVNGINVLCGVGILSTPYAIKEGGWAGLSILFVFAVLSWYTGTLLRACLESNSGLETYPDIGQAAFGTKGRILISIILYLELYACCVEYIILESDNLSSLFPGVHLDVGGVHLTSNVLFAVLTTLIVLPTTWLRDLSVLSYISAGGVIASVLIVLCLFWVGIDEVGFHHVQGPALNFSSLPIAVGLYAYCYSGHAVFPNIYSSLKKPDQFPSVLLACFGICTLLFGGVAVMGYLMFGDSIQSQFTLNLPQGLVASKIAVWTTVVNPITKYALTITPLALSLEELIPPNYMKSHIYAVGIRSFLTVTTLFVALSIPFFGLVMSLIGSFLTMLVTFIFPCICFLSILRGKVTWPQTLLCGLIIGVGCTSAGFGSYSSISEIVKNLR